MPIRNIFISAFLTLAIFTAIAYTSCKKDKCENVICLNLGACDEGSCVCPIGYEGDRCEILSRDKFIFTYNGHDTCNIDTTKTFESYPIYFRAVLNNPRQMMMKNFLNDMDDSAICTVMGIDTFVFNGANNSTTYVGTGKWSNDSLWLVYRVERDTTSYDCKFFGQGLR